MDQLPALVKDPRWVIRAEGVALLIMGIIGHTLSTSGDTRRTGFVGKRESGIVLGFNRAEDRCRRRRTQRLICMVFTCTSDACVVRTCHERPLRLKTGNEIRQFKEADKANKATEGKSQHRGRTFQHPTPLSCSVALFDPKFVDPPDE